MNLCYRTTTTTSTMSRTWTRKKTS